MSAGENRGERHILDVGFANYPALERLLLQDRDQGTVRAQSA